MGESVDKISAALTAHNVDRTQRQDPIDYSKVMPAGWMVRHQEVRTNFDTDLAEDFVSPAETASAALASVAQYRSSKADA